MLSKRIWLAFTLATSLVSVAIGLQSIRLVRRTEAALAALSEQRAALERKIRLAERQTAPIRRPGPEPSAPGHRDSPVRASVGPAARPLPSTASAARSSPKAIAALAGDPKLQELYFASARPRCEALYLQLFRDLHLSPAQIARFEDLVIRRREQWLDLVAAMQADGLAPDDPAVVRLQRQIADEFRSGQLDLLGNAGYVQVEAYERSLPVRQIANQFAGYLVLEDQSLTGVQVSQLTQVLAQASPSYQQGGVADPGAVDWTQAVAGSSGVLTPVQQDLFLHVAPTLPVDDDSLDWANLPTPPGVGPPRH